MEIDVSFVAAMLGGGVDAAVVEAVVRLGAALGVTVVAEGVEDAATAERLVELAAPSVRAITSAGPSPIAAVAARLMDAGKVIAAA